MKADQLVRRIRMVLLCLLWLVSLVAVPLLAKAAANWMGDLIKPESSGRVPLPPPVVSNEPVAVVMPGPSPVVVSVPVPTPPLPQTVSLSHEQPQRESESIVKAPVGASQAVTLLYVSLIVICSMLHRRFVVHSAHQECAS